MGNTLWEKLFHIARNFGTAEDMRVIDLLTGKDPRKNPKSRTQMMDIQERWNARQQKRKLTRVLSSFGVPPHPDKM